MTGPKRIAFGQRIKLEWFDLAATLLSGGADMREIRTAVQSEVRQTLSVGSTAKKSNAQKATCIVMRTWVTVSPQHITFRDKGLELWKRGERLPIHWGLAMTAYPFFASVAEHVGRSLQFQDAIHDEQILRKVRSEFGDRPTIIRATQRLLRNLGDWGILKAGARPPRLAQTIPWLLEAALLASGETYASVRSALSNPALFPFQLTANTIAEVHAYQRLDVFQQGLGEESISLRSA